MVSKREYFIHVDDGNHLHRMRLLTPNHLFLNHVSIISYPYG